MMDQGEIERDDADTEVITDEVAHNEDIEEGVKAKSIRKPQEPTRQEIEEHELTHVPFREWCVHCCKGKCRSSPHRVNKHKEAENAVNAVTTISMDYMYMNEKSKEEEKDPIIVVTDRKTKAIVGHMVNCKGSRDEWAVKRVLLDIEDFGYAGTKIVLKNDQEPAMVDMQKKVMAARSAETVPKNSEVGESQSNGEVENAIKRFQEQLRTLKDDLEAKTGLDIEMKHAIIPWLVEWTGVTLNRYLIYKDGRTAYQNITGKSSKRPVAVFGEKILYMPLKTERLKMDKGEAKLREGIWLGLKSRSDEAIVGTATGVVKARTIRRLPKEKRWDPSAINAMRGSPRRPVPGVESDHLPTDTQAGVLPGSGEDDVVIALPKEGEIRHNAPRAEEGPRRMYITRAFIEKYGKTAGCPGCRALDSGEHGVHNQECRDRIMGELAKDEEGRRKLQGDKYRVERRKEVAFDKAIRREMEKHPELKKQNEAFDEEITQIQKKYHREQRGEQHGQSSASSSASAPASASASVPSASCVNDENEENKPAAKRIKSVRFEDMDVDNGSGKEDNKRERGDADHEERAEKRLRGDIGAVDVTEISSPPRTTTTAKRMGLTTGSSMDITTYDVDGRPWDFNEVEMRNRAFRRVMEEKPLVLITGTMCTNWSIAMNSDWGRLGAYERKKRLNNIKIHLGFVCTLHLLQHREGRYFIHEHPRSATSWREPCMQNVMRRTGAILTTLDQCMYGLVQKVGSETLPARRATTLMSNMPAVQATLSTRCDGQHRHVVLAGGTRTRETLKYPEKLCEAIVEAIKLQKQWDSTGVKLLGVLKRHASEGEIEEKLKVPDEEEDHNVNEYVEDLAWDDVSGKYLDADAVRQARADEIEYYRKMGVYKKVPIAECLARTGHKPIGVRWVDIDKGDRTRPKYRSRLVAKQYRQQKDDDLYAATPPIEALRIVVSSATTGSREKVLMVNDVSRAYFYAPCDEDIYVDLCEEDRDIGEEHMCGKLVKAMYGTRTAARMWQREVANTLREAGFSAGRTSPCLFYHAPRDIMVFLHGDDFVSSGSPEDLKWFETVLRAKYCITTTFIGEDPKFEKQATVLNRLVRWQPGEGVTIEADPRHVEILIDSTEVQNERTLTVTGERDAGNTRDNAENLTAPLVSKYRADIARLNYLATDRPDLMYAVKELARKMATPSVIDAERVRRLVRYLKGRPRAVAWYRYQDMPRHVDGYTDSDWAGCRVTRRSTSGGCIMYGSHYLKGWSRTQSVRALSSAEAELYGIVKTSAEIMGIASIFKDFGTEVAGHVLCDASAALGVVRRKGIGKIRHLDTSMLWVQEKNEKREIRYEKVAGCSNPADLFTKHLSGEITAAHLHRLGYKHIAGQDGIGLSIHHLGVECEERRVRRGCHHLHEVTPSRRGGVRECAPFLVYSCMPASQGCVQMGI